MRCALTFSGLRSANWRWYRLRSFDRQPLKFPLASPACERMGVWRALQAREQQRFCQRWVSGFPQVTHVRMDGQGAEDVP
jgi:hypothetical protein